MLGRTAKRALRKHARALTNTAVCNGVPSEPSLWDKVLNRTSMKRVPLSEPYDPQFKIEPRPDPKQGVDVSTLTNGLRVASTEASVPISSVGVYIEVGSRHENPSNNGLTSFMEKIAFKSNNKKTEFETARHLFSIGAHVSATTTRESLFYVGDSLPQHSTDVLEVFANSIQHHTYHPVEISAAVKAYQANLKEKENNMEQLMLEAVHEAAYHGNTTGFPVQASASQVEKFNDEKLLRDFARTFFNPKRMIVGGVGVDHDRFVERVSKLFNSFPSTGVTPTVETARYTGGEVKMDRRWSEKTSTSHDKDLTHLALAFETASWHDKDVVPMCVLQVLMGGGGSFSAGGPGKGMYSRLYRNVLNSHHFFDTATCFNSIFADSALFGVYGSSPAEHATAMAEVLVTELIRMTGDISEEELKRAKNQLKSSVYYQLENRNLTLEDLCRQLSVYGKIETPQTVVSWIDAVTVDDVHRVAQKMLKTPLTMASYGDLRNLPRYDQVANVIASNI